MAPDYGSLHTLILFHFCSSLKIVLVLVCVLVPEKLRDSRNEFWFSLCADSDGRVTGSDAIKLFSMSNLSRQDLKQVRFDSVKLV